MWFCTTAREAGGVTCPSHPQCSFPFAFPFDAMIPIEVHVLILQRSRSFVDVFNRDYVATSPTSDPRASRDSSSSFFNRAGPGALPRGAVVSSRTNGTRCNWTSHVDTGREGPVKGGFDELNEGGWDFTQASQRWASV